MCVCTVFFTPCKYCVIFALPSVVCECGSVAEGLGCWTCDQRVAGSNPGFPAIECSPVGCLFGLAVECATARLSMWTGQIS